jgi:hypothetical protein
MDLNWGNLNMKLNRGESVPSACQSESSDQTLHLFSHSTLISPSAFPEGTAHLQPNQRLNLCPQGLSLFSRPGIENKKGVGMS